VAVLLFGDCTDGYAFKPSIFTLPDSCCLTTIGASLYDVHTSTNELEFGMVNNADLEDQLDIRSIKSAVKDQSFGDPSRCTFDMNGSTA
jgi:hypothetical protein